MRSILVYGDSNTYGYDPRGAGEMRYPKNVRWTGILDQSPGFSVKNAGRNGAGIPLYPRAAAEFFSSEIRSFRADRILIWLGVNDLLNAAVPSAEKVALKMKDFLEEVEKYDQKTLTRVVLLSPHRLSEGTWTDRKVAEESGKFGLFYRDVALQFRIPFLDMGTFDLSLTADGVHFSPEGHRSVSGIVRDFLLKLENET